VTNVKIIKIIPVVLMLTLSACGWVDSTGKQVTVLPAQIDSTLVILNNGDSFPISENMQRTVVFDGSDSAISQWTWNQIDGQGNIDSCLGFNGFEQPIATNELGVSCARDAVCEITISESIVDGIARFDIVTPQLRAPLALAYNVSTTLENGTTINRAQTLCASPINDAPEAVDDTVSVTRGQSLLVLSDDERSLLFNDKDDDDIRNQPLTVNTTPVVAPRFAESFELFNDGGFWYEPAQNAPLSINGSISDFFTYSIFDGTSESTATVSVKVIDFNSAPILNFEIPEITAYIEENASLANYAFLEDYFFDAEGDQLTYTVIDDSLPESGNVWISIDGALQGIPDEDDSGRYYVVVEVSDFVETTEAGFFLNVARPSGFNRAPTVDDIDNKVVRDDFEYDVSAFFVDRDDDHLAFTASGLPAGVQISPKGIIFGTANDDNEGRFIVRVQANDGNGGTDDDGFRLIIR